MRFIAVCHLCGTKQIVPSKFDTFRKARVWASDWEDEHIGKEHGDDNTEQTASTEGS